MTRSEAPQFLEMLASLCELYGAKLSSPAQTLYFESLRDLTLSDIQESFGNCARKLKFMPKPVEMRDLVTPFSLASGLEDDAAEAWQIARRGLSHYGAGGPPKDWQKDIQNAVKAAYGSWWTAATGEFSDGLLESKRKSFTEAWKRAANDRIECDRQEALEKLDELDRATGFLPANQRKLLG